MPVPWIPWLLFALPGWAIALCVARLRMLEREAAQVEARARTMMIDELEQSQSARTRAEAMATVGELTASVTHDISSPLTSLLTNLELVDQHPLPESMREAIGDSIEAAQHITSVVQDVRQLLRSSQTDEKVDLRKPLGTAIRLARSSIQASGSLQTDLGRAPRVRAHSSRLAQVFLNLLMNAAQAIARSDRDDHVVTVRLSHDADGDAIIQVIDDGPGMTPEVLARVTEPLYTTRLQEGGTGLGLSMCKRLVDQASGSLTIESTPGRGTTVTVRLPDCERLFEEDTLPDGPNPRMQAVRRRSTPPRTPPEGNIIS